MLRNHRHLLAPLRAVGARPLSSSAAGPRVVVGQQVLGLPTSPTVTTNEMSNDMIAAGQTVYKLGLGQSPFPVYQPVVDALREHAAEKDYLPVRGLRALRQAVADYHNTSGHGVGNFSADQVLIGPGSKELMFILQMACYSELLLAQGSWVSYEPQAELIGRRVRWCRTELEDDWRLSAESLDEACRAGDPSGSRILILNTPNNPTGVALDRTRMSELADVAREHKIIVLSDEIYGELHHSREHLSFSSFYPEGTIISSGISKWCGAGGWRCGTFALPPQLERLAESMAVVASETFTSVSAPIQHATITAFQRDAGMLQYLDAQAAVCAAIGQRLARILRDSGAYVPEPSGGFYLMPTWAHGSDTADGLLARGIDTSTELVKQLLANKGVATLSGDNFGLPSDLLSLRLSYVNFDGAAALQAAIPVLAAGDSLPHDFVDEYAPETVKAVQLMADFVTGN
eukprot:PLAT11969.1.p1 GENE.PLAT11969.1~~PLAT11969.1.p1  ORF type:complete len:475 (-),score=188.91 PLAT11969.1:93-1469(-)